MVGVDRVGDLDHAAPRAPRGAGLRAPPEFVDADVPPVVRVVDVEAPAATVVRGKGRREQSPLSFEGDQPGDVEEGVAETAPVAQHLDPAALLDDEEQAREAGRAGHVDRAVEAADLLEGDLAASGGIRPLARGGAAVAVHVRGARRCPARGQRCQHECEGDDAGPGAPSHASYLPDLEPFPPLPISTISPESVTSVAGGVVEMLTAKVPPGLTPPVVSAFALPLSPASTP